MLRKSLSFLCALAMVIGMIVPMSGTVHAAEDNTCCCGATDVTWVTMTDNMDMQAGVHYRLEKNTSQKKTLSTAGTYCIDLAGYTLTGTNRVFNLGGAVVMNVMDSSAKQTGSIEGYGGAGNSGGLIYIVAGGTFNLYSGTIQPNTTDVVAYSGGIFAVYGTLNVYGGTIVGGKLGGTSAQLHAGGTICVQSGGEANFYGGNVVSGIAESDDLGHCVYVKSGGVASISGNARVDQIALAENNASMLTVKGAFTGTAELLFPETVTAGTAIAVSDNATISGTLTVAGSDLVVITSGNSVVAGEGRWCEACNAKVIWQELSGALPNAAGHYKLTGNVSAKQVSLNAIGGTICLDLAGYTYTGAGRTFTLSDVSGDSVKDTVNIMDSSDGNTGAMQAKGGSDGHAGGIFRTYSDTVLNVYDANLEYLTRDDIKTKYGAVAVVQGVMNVYGNSKLVGGKVATTGGAIDVLKAGTLNVYGGEIIGGEAGTAGGCVHVTSGGTVNLSGNASVEELYFAGSSAAKLTISGTYTGKTNLLFATMPVAGTDIGDCSDAVIGKENISISGTRLYAAVSGTNLVVSALQGASVTDGDSVAYYDTLAQAVTGYTAGTVKLLADNSESVTLPGGMILDLNGWDLTGNVTVSGDKVCVKDTATDDYNVDDVAGYGKIPVAIKDFAEPVENYLVIAEDTGVSYHRYVLEISKVNLRPGAAGLYYTADVKLSSTVLDKIDSYGIAMSTGSKNPALEDAKTLYTAIAPENYSAAGTNSVLINAVMDPAAQAADNTIYAATMIYGRPYIKFEGGTCIYGSTCAASLQKVTEAVNEKFWDKLSLVQNRALMNMYSTYTSSMVNWKVSNIATSAAKKQAAAEDGILKAIVLGNSHSTDSTNLLGAIMMTEAPEVEFVLGCMYESGCPIEDHVTFYENESPVYTYYKNCGEKENGAWTGHTKSTLQDGLTDENWDMVIFQATCIAAGKAASFTDNNDLETLMGYVVDSLGYEPQLVWHEAGGIPNIPENYANYVMGLEGDDGGGNDGGENEEWEDDGTSQPEDMAWIFDIARPDYPVSWAKKYIEGYNNDDQVMFDAHCYVSQNYVLNNDLYNLSLVIPSASALQYARNMGMTDQEMFRDYAHRSDYSRVIVSYVWYATLMGITELDELQYTTVPAEMRHKKFVQYGDLVLDERQYDMALNAVNWALVHPYDSPEPVTTE